MFDWTDECIAVLTERWLKGTPVADIAKELGTGRNGVVGKAHRLGLPAHKDAARFAPKPRQTTPQKSGPVLAQKCLVSRGTHFAEGDKPAPVLPMMPDGANIPIEQRRTLLQLNNSVCRWPFGDPHSPDFFFCGGDAVDGKPYCAGHCRRAYQSRAA